MLWNIFLFPRKRPFKSIYFCCKTTQWPSFFPHIASVYVHINLLNNEWGVTKKSISKIHRFCQQIFCHDSETIIDLRKISCTKFLFPWPSSASEFPRSRWTCFKFWLLASWRCTLKQDGVILKWLANELFNFSKGSPRPLCVQMKWWEMTIKKIIATLHFNFLSRIIEFCAKCWLPNPLLRLWKYHLMFGNLICCQNWVCDWFDFVDITETLLWLAFESFLLRNKLFSKGKMNTN